MRIQKMFGKKISAGTIAVVLAAAFLYGAPLHAQGLWSALDQAADRKEVPITNETVVRLVERLKPAVVNISVTQVIKRDPVPFGGEDPMDFWKRFFGDQVPKEFQKKGVGSGFIINKEGYVVTNNHVVQKARDITVILYNKKQYPATVVGTDPKVDVALIKIEAEEDLPFAPLGNSDRLREGESVIAIGNPFGLSETVTSGIVSAKGRVIGAGPYDDFIQTDASINPGNSGGPLFNFYGEVVGINTAIIASGQGIGFAVPINAVKEVLLQLKESGKVTRGWLGVSIQEITPELARSFGLKDERGALVSDVVPGGPADKAGLKRGDIITEINGRVIADYHELPRAVASMSPGERAVIKALRDGKEATVSIIVAELKDEEELAKPSEEVQKQIGISLQTVTPEIARDLGMKKTEGVVITNVEQGSLAAEAGIQRGDVIIEIDRKAVNNVKEAAEAIKQADKSILFLLYRKGSTIFVSLKIS